VSDLDRQLSDAVAEEKITPDDAERIREFAEFLTEVGPPEGPATQQRRAAILKHADHLGLTEEERARVQARYDQEEAHQEWLAQAPRETPLYTDEPQPDEPDQGPNMPIGDQL